MVEGITNSILTKYRHPHLKEQVRQHVMSAMDSAARRLLPDTKTADIDFDWQVLNGCFTDSLDLSSDRFKGITKLVSFQAIDPTSCNQIASSVSPNMNSMYTTIRQNPDRKRAFATKFGDCLKFVSNVDVPLAHIEWAYNPSPEDMDSILSEMQDVKHIIERDAAATFLESIGDSRSAAMELQLANRDLGILLRR